MDKSHIDQISVNDSILEVFLNQNQKYINLIRKKEFTLDQEYFCESQDPISYDRSDTIYYLLRNLEGVNDDI